MTLAELAPLWLLLSFIVLSILIPGFLIWLGLKVIGKNRGVLRCGFANFAAFALAAIVSFLFYLTPLAVLLPVIAFIIYFYALKTLLEINFIEAFAATIIAGIIVFLLAILILLLFGIWLLITPPPVSIPHFDIRF